MNTQRILDELIALLEPDGVTIRNEHMGGGGGGLCTIKGQRIFFVDVDAPAEEVAVKAAQALRKVADIETLYIRPEVRRFIESHSEGIT